MPARPLIRVLLPAPLSPTSAVTSPARMSRSTFLSTSMAPKLLLMPRNDRSGTSPALADGAWSAVMVMVTSRTWVDAGKPAAYYDAAGPDCYRPCAYCEVSCWVTTWMPTNG